MSYTYNDYVVDLLSGRVLEADADHLDSIPAHFININDKVNNTNFDNWYNNTGSRSNATGRGNYAYQIFDNNGKPMTNYN